VRVRLAPSPTGDPHIGTAYTALIDLAFALQQGGQFILRIEDTDQARYVPESEQRIFEYLRWLGLSWHEGPDVGGPCGPYRQSERLDRYRPVAAELIARGAAYRCWCTPERLERVRREREARRLPPRYDRFCLGKSEAERRREGDFSPQPVVRLRVPDAGQTSFHDLIRGTITFENSVLNDLVLLKSDGYPTYHLAVVVDDHEMQITHVIRGEEWISSTPIHVLLYQALDWELPQFVHLPLLRNPDRGKVSKRRHPWAVLPWFKEQGYLPEALLNYLGQLAVVVPDPQRPGAAQELFGLAEVAQHLDFSKMSSAGPVVDLEKLNWLNGQYIRALPLEELARRVRPFLEQAGLSVPDDSRLLVILRLEQERLRRLAEAQQQPSPLPTRSWSCATGRWRRSWA